MGWTHHHLHHVLYIDQVIRLSNPNGYRPPRGRTPASTSITPHHRGITHLALRYHAAWHFHHRQLTSPLHAQCYTVPRSRRKTCVTVPQKHLHWVSKRQAATARSSAEVEIITSDECLKWLQHTSHILEDLHVKDIYFSKHLPIYNDNNACVVWSKGKTTKGLRHI